MNGNFMKITILSGFPMTISEEFEPFDPEEVKVNPSKYLGKGIDVSSIAYYVVEYKGYVPARIWTSSNDMILGVQGKTWYIVHTEPDEYGNDSTSYIMDPSEERGGVSD